MKNKKPRNEYNLLVNVINASSIVLYCTILLILLLAGGIFGQLVQLKFDSIGYIINVIAMLVCGAFLIISSVIFSFIIKKRKNKFYSLPQKEQALQKNYIVIHVQNDEKGNDLDRLFAGEKLLVNDESHLIDGKIYIVVEKE